MGDPTRVAQFLALALEDLCAAATALVIVISEVAGDRFRISVHVEGVRSVPSTVQELAMPMAQFLDRFRVLLQAIARAHGGKAQFDRMHSQGGLIASSFASPAGSRRASKPTAA